MLISIRDVPLYERHLLYCTDLTKKRRAQSKNSPSTPTTETKHTRTVPGNVPAIPPIPITLLPMQGALNRSLRVHGESIDRSSARRARITRIFPVVGVA